MVLEYQDIQTSFMPVPPACARCEVKTITDATKKAKDGWRKARWCNALCVHPYTLDTVRVWALDASKDFYRFCVTLFSVRHN